MPITDKAQDNNKRMDSQDERDKDDEIENLSMQIVEIQNRKCRMEVELRKKSEEVKALANKNKLLQDDVVQNRSLSMRMLKDFEARAKQADNRIQKMSQELVRTQELAKKYKGSYESLLNTKASQSQTDDPEQKQIRVHYQMLLDKNAALESENKRLRGENAELELRVKHAEEDKTVALKMQAVSEKERSNLSRHLEKQKAEKFQLNDTLNKQTDTWIKKKRQMRALEEEMKWNLIKSTVVCQHDALEAHRLTMNRSKSIYLPRRLTAPRPTSAMP